MTQRSRRRHRRRGGLPSKVGFVAIAVLALVAAVAIGVTSWVLNVADNAPSLSSCKPIDKGGNSTLYAGDGTQAGGDRLRRGPHPGRDPADPGRPAAGDDRDRGPALLPARGGRPGGHPAGRGQGLPGRCRGRGRLDDHPAVGPQPLHPRPRGERRTQDHRGEAGRRVFRAPLEEGSPRPVPEHGLIRDRRRQHRGRGPGRLEDLLLAPGLEARPRPQRTARRPAPGADRIQPDPQRDRGPRAAQRGAGEDGRTRLRLRRRSEGGGAARARPRHLPELLPARPALLLRLRRGPADRILRRQHRPPGRARRLHDDRPEAAGSRARSDAIDPPLLDRPLLGVRLDRPPQR